VITCTSAITVNATAGACTANVTIAATTATDNCAVASITNNYNGGGANAAGVYAVGTTRVVITATDVYGNTATGSVAVTVVDNQNPTITCPSAQTLVLNASCAGVLGNYTSLATAADNCTVASVTQSPAAGTAVSGVGTTVVTLTVTDAAGNTSIC